MDGRPSAPDSGPEPFELTKGSSRPSDTERELDTLRARAYGPDADIDADPGAMARLVELEAAHLAAVTAVRAAGATADVDVDVDAVAVAAPVIEFPHEASRRHRAWLSAGVIVLCGIAVAAAVWNLAPRPDATLREAAVEGGSDIIRVLSAQGRGPDASTLRRFEPYHDVGVWSFQNAAGKVCFVVWDRLASGRFSIKCALAGTEVALSLTVESEGVDDFAPWLPDGSIVDFHLREHTVDVFVRPPTD
ncbi:MAG TPA: hypothetical protein VJU58_11065 [Microbacterium sp.]|nr:hypothetical protein [Microbacterium sp.]